MSVDTVTGMDFSSTISARNGFLTYPDESRQWPKAVVVVAKKLKKFLLLKQASLLHQGLPVLQ